MSDNPTGQRPESSFERRVERSVGAALLAARWLVLPIYFGFVAALVLVVIKFVGDAVDACLHLEQLSLNDLIVAMLRLIDLSLVANLLIIVMLAGYENFVSRIVGSEQRDDRPQWLDHIDFSALKRKLVASIVVISAVDLLERFMDIQNQNRAVIAALGGLLLLFAVVGLLLAATDRLAGGKD